MMNDKNISILYRCAQPNRKHLPWEGADQSSRPAVLFPASVDLLSNTTVSAWAVVKPDMKNRWKSPDTYSSMGNHLNLQSLKGNVPKNQTFSKYGGNNQKINSADILRLARP